MRALKNLALFIIYSYYFRLIIILITIADSLKFRFKCITGCNYKVDHKLYQIYSALISKLTTRDNFSF